MTKIAIIGAGISGLTLAYYLDKHANVTLFETSRGVSGRTSTRYAEPFSFDHGAQYFTARTPVFQQFIKPLIENDIIKRWNACYVNFDNNIITRRVDWSQDEPRYVGVPRMNAMAQYLAQGLDIRLNCHIVSLDYGTKWCLKDQNNMVFDPFDWVISTIPAPQAVDLLPKSFSDMNRMESVKMLPCYSLMLGFSKALDLEFDAAHVINSDISWIAVNSNKPERSNHYTLMVHSSDMFAKNHIHNDYDKVMHLLCEEVHHIIGHDVSNADYKTVHGWLYASNKRYESKQIYLDSEQQLAACGDWCEGGRIEGAFTSAYKLAHKIKDHLNE